MRKTILIVAAHPDDEVLGCGGTVAKRAEEGCAVYTLILGEGVTSRDKKRIRHKRESDIETLRKNARRANRILGVKEISFFDFPDNRFDTVALLDIIKVIEEIMTDKRPDIIYTHHKDDLNIDHRITYKAVLTACRPISGQKKIREDYSFEAPSSTEWNYPYTFSPNLFVDITDTIDKKIEALRIYVTEARRFPHPRSEEAIKSLAKWRGSMSGLNSAEAFEVVRIIT